MIIIRPFNPAGYLVWVILIGATFYACQTGGFTDLDQVIPPDQRIVLKEGGPHTGKSDTGDVRVTVEYTWQPDQQPQHMLNIKGRFTKDPGDADEVNIYLLALDGQGHELARDLLFASGFNRNVGNGTFDDAVEIPAGTLAIAFDANIRRSRGEQ